MEEPIQIDIYVECQLGGICSLALLWVNFLSNDVSLNFTPFVWDLEAWVWKSFRDSQAPMLLHALVLSLTSSLPMRELPRCVGVGAQESAGMGVLGKHMNVAMRGAGTCSMQGMQHGKRRVYQRLDLKGS